MNYEKDLVKDFKIFNQVVGGAMELADRGWREDVWCSDQYKETLEDLYKKYLPIKSENFIPLKVDDYLDIENEIADFLEEELLELML